MTKNIKTKIVSSIEYHFHPLAEKYLNNINFKNLYFNINKIT